MSHFLTLVIGDEPEKQLERYDDTLVLPMHLFKTQKQIISDQRKKIDEYKRRYLDVYQENPEAYRLERSKAFVDYVANALTWTDDQVYMEAVKPILTDIENGSPNVDLHEDGSIWHTYNDIGKWDWYQMGGRYAGKLKLKDKKQHAPLFLPSFLSDEDLENFKQFKKDGRCDQARIKEISNLDEIKAYAVVLDGNWYERGEMIWSHMEISKNDVETWNAELSRLLMSLSPETLLTVYDCHK